VFSEARVLDLRSLGLLHRACASPAASPEHSAIFKGFPTGFTLAPTHMVPRATISAVSFFFLTGIYGFSIVFWACFSAAVGSGLGVSLRFWGGFVCVCWGLFLFFWGLLP
jgi:hypothetical protein